MEWAKVQILICVESTSKRAGRPYKAVRMNFMTRLLLQNSARGLLLCLVFD